MLLLVSPEVISRNVRYLFIFTEVKVTKFRKECSLPDCYTMIDHNFQMDVEGEVGYRYVVRAKKCKKTGCALSCIHRKDSAS